MVPRTTPTQALTLFSFHDAPQLTDAVRAQLPRSPAHRWIMEGDRSPEIREMWIALGLSALTGSAMVSIWPGKVSSVNRPWWATFASIFFLADYAFIVAYRVAYVGMPGVYEGLWVCSLRCEMRFMVCDEMRLE